MSNADEIVDRVVDRFAGRLPEDVDEETLRRVAHAVARSILSTPLGYLNSTETDADAVDIVARAFGVDDV